MALGYRTVLTADATAENAAAIHEVLRAWVVGRKGFKSLPASGTVTSTKGAQLTALHDDESAWRWEFSEEWTLPEWYVNPDTSRVGVTTITLLSDGAALWLWVDIEPPVMDYVEPWSGRRRVESHPSGTPNFVKVLIDEVAMRDGVAEPLSGFQHVVTRAHVMELLKVVSDGDRFGSVYVTSPPTMTATHSWAKKAEELVGAVQGMGFGYVLSPEMLDEFNAEVTATHSVPRGGMRTFLPGARFGDSPDSHNHRVMYPTAMASSDDRRLRRAIRNAQVARLESYRLPRVLRDADYRFLRMQKAKTFEAVPTQSDDAAVLAEANERLVAQLQSAENDSEQFLRDYFALESETTDLKETVLLLESEVDSRYEDLTKARDEIAYLRRQLIALGTAEGTSAAYAPVPDDLRTDYPETFAELLSWMPRLSGIAYFGNQDDALELDSQAGLGEAVVMKAWDTLRTLDTYVAVRKSGAYDGALHQYLSNQQHGHFVRTPQPQWNEGKTVRTNDRMSAQRRVTGIPEHIVEGGVLDIFAHFALATGRANSPRLYFEDRYGSAGIVLVGYLGGHLDVVSTN